MASNREFMIEWIMLDEDCNNWTQNDLQLAAELGRNLLERNEELENEVKAQQVLIEDQLQEIEYLSKQVSSMKEENLNRSKFYEQLESSLYELERTNAQLNQKSELDKKRILNMCEDIDYLERKCEELSSTLDSIREANAKKWNRDRKFFQNGRNGGGNGDFCSLGGSTDSSEEEFIFNHNYKKRAQSLQNLRDFTSSPFDDCDLSCSNPNSPGSNSLELKHSECEFIQALESRVEELVKNRKKESDKINQLESQIRILLQENSNLQEQLCQITKEKQEEIHSLRKQLLDTSCLTCSELTSSDPASSSSCDDFNKISTSTPISNVPAISNGEVCKTSSNDVSKKCIGICKRCSMEINVLNLVNSIEYENDDYSSLEFEMANACESLGGNDGIHSICSTSSSGHGTFDRINCLGSSEFEGNFEPGFLNYFFGTNSMLKKIHLKRSQEEPGTKSERSHNRLNECESGLDSKISSEISMLEEPSLMKDFGTEKCGRKLKIPKIIGEIGYDENPIDFGTEVKLEVKSRSKMDREDFVSKANTKCDRSSLTHSPSSSIESLDSIVTIATPSSSSGISSVSSNVGIPEYKQILHSVYSIHNETKQFASTSSTVSNRRIKVIGITGLN